MVYKIGKLFFDSGLVKDVSELDGAFDGISIEYSDARMSDLWAEYAERVNDVGESLGMFGYEVGEKWSEGARYGLEDNGTTYEFGFVNAAGAHAIVMRALSVDEEVGSSVITAEIFLEFIPTEEEIRSFIREN